MLDEVLRILNYVATTTTIGRAYKVTDELFDLSTMAMEYFKEKIEPTLPEINLLSHDFTPMFSTPNSRSVLMKALEVGTEETEEPDAATPSTSASPAPAPNTTAKLRKMSIAIRRLKTTVDTCNRKLTAQRNQLRDATSKIEQQDRKIEEQNRRIEALITELHQCHSELRQIQARPDCELRQLQGARPEGPQELRLQGKADSSQSDPRQQVQAEKGTKQDSSTLSKSAPSKGQPEPPALGKRPPCPSDYETPGPAKKLKHSQEPN